MTDLLIRVRVRAYVNDVIGCLFEKVRMAIDLRIGTYHLYIQNNNVSPILLFLLTVYPGGILPLHGSSLVLYSIADILTSTDLHLS
jgi:hypothetical protein